MAIDKAIDSGALDAKLTAVADAIRAKGGTNAALAFPDGFVNAVAAIQAGNGGGVGGNAIQIGQNTNTPNFLNLFWALENGTAKTGEFTLAATLPNTETLIFDSGLDEIKGIFYVNADYVYSATGGVPEYGVWGLYMENLNGLAPVYAMGLSTCNAGNNSYTLNQNQFVTRCSYRFDGGKLYVTAQYNHNTSYTPFMSGEKYVWVAW